MSRGEAAALAFGVVVIFGGVLLAYRYTLSPRADERAAKANRNYRPRPTPPLTPVPGWLVGAWLTIHLALSFLPLDVAMALLALVAVGNIVYVRRRRDGARGGV